MILTEEYTNKKVLLLEHVTPSKEKFFSSPSYTNVHMLSIITIRTTAGIKVLCTHLLNNCRTWTSHSATTLCTVDAVSERIVDAIQYCKPSCSSDDKIEASLKGKQIERVQEACKVAVKAHSLSKMPFLTAVGWDLMFTDEGLCFFEGNMTYNRISSCSLFSFDFLLKLKEKIV